MKMKTKILFLFNIILISLLDITVAITGPSSIDVKNTVLNYTLYDDVLDPELCEDQVRLIQGNVGLSLFFADTGLRIPKGIFQGNNVDLGNYHQCIGFNVPLPQNVLEGKYAMIRVPLNQSFHWPDFPKEYLDETVINDNLNAMIKYEVIRRGALAMTGIIEENRISDNDFLSGLDLRMAMCIPKPCTSEQFLSSTFFNASKIGFTYREDFYRIPGDKPWVPGDYVAISLFAALGIITLISTSFDIWQTIILQKDPKSVSVLGRSFSVYTNGRRLMTFTSGSSTIGCLDGIRSLAMAWVVMGHTFGTETFFANPIEGFTWAATWKGLWVTSAHITVDTFFMLSGFLIVYTTVGKLSGSRLLKNIHLFYLNRLLRMFPLLAAAVLVEATILNHMFDGPFWGGISDQVEKCRVNWWSTLLHVQNFVNPGFTCMGQAWYLAIDVQLHILSPIVLFWVLSDNKKTAWSALLASLSAVLIASTVYNFIMEFPAQTLNINDVQVTRFFLTNYYTNTLARASPFFVGMVFGYLVRYVKLKMTRIQVVCYWVFAFGLSTFIIYSNYPTIQSDWDNQLVNNLYNSFIRPLWALFIGLLVYACVYGYGGPINWFLSLGAWKIHARLSYGIYLFHYGIMFLVNATAVSPTYFSVGTMVFKFLAHYSMAFMVSFVMTLVIDAPFSTLFKLILGEGPKKARQEVKTAETTTADSIKT